MDAASCGPGLPPRCLICYPEGGKHGKLFAIIMLVLGLFSFNFILLLWPSSFAGLRGESNSNQCEPEGTRVRDIMPKMFIPIRYDPAELKEHMFKEKHRGYPCFRER